MLTQVAAAGGPELLLMLITFAVLFAVVLTPVYMVVRLATRRRLVQDERD